MFMGMKFQIKRVSFYLVLKTWNLAEVKKYKEKGAV
jgi:hypothetical protein